MGLLAKLSDWLPARSVTLAVWCGLLVLTVWLLLLARTRWGHARPLSKCVMLSIFAHLLFGVYAYGTRVIVDYAMLPVDQPTRVHLVMGGDSEDMGDSAPGTAEASDANEWDDPSDSTLIDPPPADLPRTDADVQVPNPIVASQALPASDESTDTSSLETQTEQQQDAPADVPLPEAADNKLPISEIAPLEPQVIDVAAQNPADTEIPVQEPAPPDAQLDRQTIEASIGEPQLSDEGDAQTADGNTEPQTLTDSTTGDPADAVEGNTDETLSDNLPDDSSASIPPIASRMKPAPAAALRRPGDGAQIPKLYQGRSAAERRAHLEAAGGDEQTEAAVELALAWLAANQSEDGRWKAADFGAGDERMVLGHNRGRAGANADTAVTGLALLSFFGAGHTHFEGPYRKNVQRGLEFLLRSQAASGSLAGDAEIFAAMYSHGIAFLAISEALAMTGDARLRPYVQNAQQYSLAAQIPYDGGWRYRPGDVQGDMSQFGWQVMALRSAETAGIAIPREARQGMLRFMKSVSAGEHGGRACYRVNTRPTRTMTAEAITCRYFLQLDRDLDLEREAASFLLEEVPGGDPANLYYWYYGSLAMYQMQNERWDEWNEALKQALLSRQRKDGELAGSWDTDTLWGGYGGRVYTTAMATMSLEVYYRYLPIYRWGVARRN